MAVAGRASDLPLELIARTCKDQGYFGVGEVIGREDADSVRTSNAPMADRLHQAMLHVGACDGEVAWGFPVRPAEMQLPSQAVLEEWNRYHGGRAADALLGNLVRQIRTWRPDVLLVPAGRDGDGLADVVRQSAVAAVRLAADPAYLPEQFQAAGCGPWNVQRVYLVSDSKAQGAVALATDDWSPRLGQSWTDAALPARGLLDADMRPGLANLSVQSMFKGPNITDIMSGINSTKGGNARRAETDTLRPHSTATDGLAQRRQVENAFQHLEQDPPAFLARLAKGDELPQGIGAAEAAVLTFRIAERMYHSGRWDLADKAFSLLIERCPDDPLARRAIVWRLQYMASTECSLRVPMEGGTPNMSYTSPRGRFRPADRGGPARPVRLAVDSLSAGGGLSPARAGRCRTERLYVLDHRGVDRDAWWNAARGEHG